MMKDMDWMTTNVIYDTAYYVVVGKLRGIEVPDDKKGVEVYVSFKMEGNVDFYNREILPESGVEEGDQILQDVEEALWGISDQTLSLANAANGSLDEEGSLASSVWSLPIPDEEYQEAKEKALRAALKLASALADE